MPDNTYWQNPANPLGDIFTGGLTNNASGNESILLGSDDNVGWTADGQFKPKKMYIDPDAAKIPGYDQSQAALVKGATSAQRRTGLGMQASAVDPSQQSQFRNDQQSLAAALQAQANGQGPSLAQSQLRQGTDRNLAQALALAQSQRGAGSSSALRNIANQNAAISQQSAADSSQLALQEQMQARNQLGQVLTGARGQDLALAGQNAQLAQGAAQSNLQAGMQQRGLNDAMTQYYTSQGLSQAQAQQQANMQLQQLQSQNNLGEQALAERGYDAAGDRRIQHQQMIGRLLGGLFGGMAG